MKSDKGWWDRHLGHGQQPAPRQPQSFQQAPQQPAPAVHQQNVPMQHGYPQQGQQPPQPQVTAENFTEAMNYWQGGEATKTETQRCPKCGSNHYFSRQGEGVFGQKGRVAPSPMCFDCGYNAVYHQETVQGQGLSTHDDGPVVN